MHNKFALAAGFASVLALAPMMVQAQALLYFDAQAIRATCGGGGDCVRVVEAAMAQIRASNLSAAAINQQLAALAAGVVDSSQTGGTSRSAPTLAAIAAIAEAVSDPTQRAVITAAAQTLSQGGTVSVPEIGGSASPG